jgi:hypothetical protein
MLFGVQYLTAKFRASAGGGNICSMFMVKHHLFILVDLLGCVIHGLNY